MRSCIGKIGIQYHYHWSLLHRNIFRSRDCDLVYRSSSTNILCDSCQDLFSLLNVHIEAKSDEEVEEKDLEAELDFDPDKLEQSNIKITPIVIKIKKDETSSSGVRGQRSLKFPCPDCDEKFSCKTLLEKHARKNHGHSKCPFCDEILTKNSPRWSSHLISSHQSQQENPLYQEILKRVEVPEKMCQLCGRGFKQSGALESHLRQAHNCQTNTVACDQCGKLLKNERCLAKHKRSFHESRANSFLCVECGEVMKSKASLNSHIERYHGEKVICVECGKQFKCKRDLRRHIGNLHTAREKTEECLQCGQKYFNLVDLRNHVGLVHDKSSPKPWYCEVCPFQASRLGNLNQHRKKIHDRTNISRKRLIEMVGNDQHPFYTREDLHLVQQGIN